MKRLLVLMALMLSGFLLAQKDSEIRFNTFDAHVAEVYGDQAQALIYEDATRLAIMKDLYLNRVRVFRSAAAAAKNDPNSLSTDSLSSLTKYGFTAPEVLSHNNLNPLQFQVNYYLPSNQYYRIENSDYFLEIRAFDPSQITAQ